jgi:hypothetical protein
MSDPLALVYDFEADLNRFGDLVEETATDVLRTVGRTTAEAIAYGNLYGPGVPVDTEWTRSSFAAGLNVPAATAVERPKEALVASKTSRYLKSPTAVKSGRGQIFTTPPDFAAIDLAQLGDTIFITTASGYAPYLELNPKTRRYGPGPGSSTVFLEPVEQRFPAIVDDAAARVGKP